MSGIILGGTTVDQVARLGLVINTFDDLIDHGKAVQHLGYGVIDEFEDETGIDGAACVDQTYDGTNDYYHNAAPAATEGTFAQSQSGTMSVGDGVTDGISFGLKFQAGTSGGVGSVKIEVAGATGNFNAKAFIYSDSAGSPGAQIGDGSDTVAMTVGEKTFTFAAAPAVVSGTSYWVVFSDQDLGAGDNVTVSLCADQGASYATGKDDVVTAIVDDGVGDLRCEINIADVPPAMTVQSVASTAGAAPSSCQVTALMEAVDAVTLNTDLVFSVSADGGSTWAAIDVADYGDHGSGIAVLSGVGAPGGTGTSIKWKAVTANSKELRLHGVGVLWD